MADPTAAPHGLGRGSRESPRVLLVDPYMARKDPMERKLVELYPSLGLLQLGAYLRQRGVKVEVLDLTFERDARAVRRRIRSFSPHLVGVHTKTLMRERSLAIGREARELGAYAVAGGPDAVTDPLAYLHGGFDSVVLGEGEATLTELADRIVEKTDPESVPGVVVRRGERLARAPARPFLRDLDALPLPAWDLVDMEGYLSRWQKQTGERRSAVLTSRGCPFDCSWCSKPAFGRTFRQQSPGRVIAELRALVDRYCVDYVRFCDDVFGIHRGWLEELLGRMVSDELGIRFECLARVDLLKTDLLQSMRSAGLARVYVGVESGSQKMLDLMNRGTRLTQVERVAAALREEGVRQFWFLMLGYPGETLEDIEATLRLFRRFSPEEYSVSIATPVPGTRFHELVRDRLRGRPNSGAQNGGKALLYEAAYPEALYRWEQARFHWEAAMGKARGRLPAELLDRLGRAADQLHERVASPILLGRPGRLTSERGSSAPSVNPPRSPVPETPSG
ncbi:MAG: B12-binding domain-containing radical SAM protein [Thermoplasmata archaeon]|nr:B12-binding domain-containing radical SAM protein [Thermoplasmata archaeon]